MKPAKGMLKAGVGLTLCASNENKPCNQTASQSSGKNGCERTRVGGFGQDAQQSHDRLQKDTIEDWMLKK